ncbi:unnamed protein product [Parnassius apollo]|uniref:(apollo) hypothetical protein n=1 Tax=Parnassius apollo TaxID=110799 RepID=A0A8S3WG95_PARAO|nr:unnamed protein product [Parnassius apollo]
MYSKIILFFVSSLFLKTINGQYTGNSYNGIIGNGIPTENLVLGNPFGLCLGAPLAGLPCGAIIAETPLTYGPNIVENFPITSTSRIPPGSISIFSDNLVVEGPILVNGQLPFLASVAVQGEIPAVGRGAVSYGCGNGEIGIISEEIAPPASQFGRGNGFGYPGEVGFGYGFTGTSPNYRGCIA